MSVPRLGILFDRAWNPAGLPAFARAAEAAGADDLWVVEDLGWNGGLTAATAALGATRRLRVGLGIAPAPYRNPALFAMEAATIAAVHPGRFAAGLGHGVAGWVAAVGATPGSTMAMLEESTVAIRALLRGERVTLSGREVRLDGIQLVHPPVVVPPVLIGAVRERTVELAGRVAQGTVIAEGHGPADLAAARDRLAGVGAYGTDGVDGVHGVDGVDGVDDTGAEASPHELVAFSFCQLGPIGDELTTLLAEQAAWLGRAPEDMFAVNGSPDEAAAQVRALHAAGAATVVLRIFGDDPVDQLAAVVKAL